MKKLLLLFLCFSCWTQTFAQSEINLTPEEKDKAWELFIKKFFPKGMGEFKQPPRFYDDVAYYLVNPREQDSLVLQNMIKQIDPLIPQKAYYADNKEEANFILEVKASKDSTHFGINPNPKIGNRDGYYNNEFISQKFILKEPEKYRFTSIRKWALLGLIDDGIPSEKRSLEIKKNDLVSESFLFKEPGYYYPILDELHYELNTLDKFVLKELYADDLDQQVQNFVIEKYGYWFWLNFNFSGDVLFIIKTSSLLFLFFLVMSVAYRPILTKKYKYQVVGYLVNGMFLGNLTLFLLLATSYFHISPKDQLYKGSLAGSRLLDDFFIHLILVSVASIIFSSLLFLLDYFFLKRKHNIVHQFLMRTTNFLILTFVITLILYKIAGSLVIITVLLPLIFFAIVRSFFLYYKDRNENLIREKDVQLSQLTASKAEAEVASLHARINPHFLYNSLNSIAGLAHIDTDKTEKMALSLSDLFRHNLNRKNDQFCTIQEEIEAIKAYLEIEKIRFGDRLDYKIKIGDKLEQYLIPRNIIQPLLENAIKHGISNMESEGKITLQITREQKRVEISVYDNGPDFSEGIISGYGLQSIFDILHFTYKNKARLSWENEPEKRIWISIDENELKLR